MTSLFGLGLHSFVPPCSLAIKTLNPPRALIPDGYEVIQSTDSEGGRALQKAHNDRTKSARHEVRTTELGELRRARYPRDDLRTRGDDVISAHEGAAHNRQRKGTSDQLLTPTSRANHGCDLEAGRIAMAGRDDEAQFYSAGAPQQHCSYYWTNCGRPLLGDVFDDAGLVADRIHMARVLKNESRKPHGSRAKCTHIARLAESGDVDMAFTAKLWERLQDHTYAEAQRILLGAQLTSCRNLTNLKPCQDGDFIRDTVSALHGGGRECLFCNCQRGDRAHWSHDCPASRPELAQKDRNVAACLAFMGFCFWFDPPARWRVQLRIEELRQCGFQLHDQDPTLLVGPQDRRPDRGMTVPGDRASVLLGLWDRTSTTAFPDTMHRVLEEVVSGFSVGHNIHPAEFDIVGHIPCELRCWFRENFSLEQEILTTAITASHVFASPPRVLGAEWRAGDWASVSDSPLTDVDAARAWTKPCLAVLNEHSKGCLSRLFR